MALFLWVRPFRRYHAFAKAHAPMRTHRGSLRRIQPPLCRESGMGAGTAPWGRGFGETGRGPWTEGQSIFTVFAVQDWHKKRLLPGEEALGI